MLSFSCYYVFLSPQLWFCMCICMQNQSWMFAIHTSKLTYFLPQYLHETTVDISSTNGLLIKYWISLNIFVSNFHHCHRSKILTWNFCYTTRKGTMAKLDWRRWNTKDVINNWDGVKASCSLDMHDCGRKLEHPDNTSVNPGKHENSSGRTKWQYNSLSVFADNFLFRCPEI